MPFSLLNTLMPFSLLTTLMNEKICLSLLEQVSHLYLSFYHNTLPVKGNPDVALTLALPEFSSQFYKARHKHTGFSMQPLCQA